MKSITATWRDGPVQQDDDEEGSWHGGKQNQGAAQREENISTPHRTHQLSPFFLARLGAAHSGAAC